MSLYMDAGAGDPRAAMSADDLAMAARAAAPSVGRPAAAGDNLGLVLGGLGALALGALTITTLSHDRQAMAAPTSQRVVAPALPQPVKLAALTAAPTASATAAAGDRGADAGAIDPNQSRAMAMIIDNTASGEAASNRSPPAQGAAVPAGGAAPASALLSADEQFAGRVGGDGSAAAHAVGLNAPAYAVVQGTIIPAVLETALNSDLPGYSRAIVSRDVRSFDGSRVVISRGSRLIGQYKSGLATGQSRAFIVWTRLIRPDGASIELGSPVMSEAGETGITGRVNRHFLQRYGSAILLSVVGGVAGSLGDGSNTVVIGTSSQAQSAAAQALQTDGKIGPTVRVPQGTPIQVFAARDLDFSGV